MTTSAAIAHSTTTVLDVIDGCVFLATERLGIDTRLWSPPMTAVEPAGGDAG